MMQQLIDEGIELYREHRELGAKLRKIKAKIREHAKKVRRGDETKVELKGEHGTIDVIFKDDRMVVSKGDVDAVFELRGDLGEVFDDIFVGSVSYGVVDEFRQAVDELPHELQAAVLELITIKTPAPSVKFPK